MISCLVSGYLRYSFLLQHALDLGFLVTGVAQKAIIKLGVPDISAKLKHEYKSLLSSYQIRKDIEIICVPAIQTGFAVGGNLCFLKAPIILMDADLIAKNQNLKGFLFKHELAHIYYNDNIYLKIICLVGSIATLALGIIYGMGAKAVFFSQFLVSTVSSIGYSQFYEKRADEFAIQNSSLQEITAAIEMFQGLKLCQIGMRRTFFLKLCYQSSGDNQWDFFHPRLSKRIQKLENEVLKRKGNLNLSKRGILEIKKHFMNASIR